MHDVVTTHLEKTAYVLVTKNHLRIRHVESQREETFAAQPTFSTTRQLVGDFTVAETLLKRALKKVLDTKFLSFAPRVVIQPLEMLEGGLSQVEERILHEMAVGAGASKVVVWVGPKLTDAEVVAKLKG